MRRALVIAGLVVAALPWPATAQAGCTAVEDPAGDVRGAGNAYGLAPVTEAPGAADITRLGVGYEGEDLVVALMLARPAGDRTVRHDVSWRHGEKDAAVFATNAAGSWRFSRTVDAEDGAIAGSVSGETVLFRIARGDAAYAPPGSILDRLQASTVIMDPIAFMSFPMWSDATDVVDFKLRTECLALVPAALMCTVLTDGAGDVGGDGEEQDPQIDIRSVAFGSNESALTVRIVVASLTETAPTGHRWSATWKVKDGYFDVSVERPAGEPPRFGFSSPGRYGAATGFLDAAAGAITIVLDREALSIADGVPLEDIAASASGSPSGSAIWTGYDGAPDGDPGGRFVPGAACGADVFPCPPVADRAGDAGPILSGGDMDVPRNEPALDLRSLGAATHQDTIGIAVRVADASAGLSPGWDVAGWTISWSADSERRYYAQAVRTSEGVRYSFGRAAGSERDVTGPVFGGRRTTGSIDGNVVTVHVPRRAAGVSVGDVVQGLAASSWIMRSASTAAPYRTLDITDHGRYLVGSVCGP